MSHYLPAVRPSRSGVSASLAPDVTVEDPMPIDAMLISRMT
jgi:hypothetical protein